MGASEEEDDALDGLSLEECRVFLVGLLKRTTTGTACPHPTIFCSSPMSCLFLCVLVPVEAKEDFTELMTLDEAVGNADPQQVQRTRTSVVLARC